MICRASGTFGRLAGILEAWGAYDSGVIITEGLSKGQVARLKELFEAMPRWFIIDALQNGMPSEQLLLLALARLCEKD